MTTLTEKEKKALISIIDNAGNGATNAEEMKEDNFTWFNHTTIMSAGFSEPQAKGIMSALQEKGLAYDDEPTKKPNDKRFTWYLSDKGIDAAYEAKQVS